MNLKKIRKDYKKNSLAESSVDRDPIKQFETWLHDAITAGVEEPTAMFLATVTKSGTPAGRIVLLKDVSAKGFVFFTNYGSAKGRDISGNPAVSLVFHWKELERQVRISGTAKRIPAKESDEYFNSRPVESRISAIISPQSQVIPSREYLEKEQEGLLASLNEIEITRPEFWGGFLVRPYSLEFWQGRESRLHDRIHYSYRKKEWIIERLAP